MSSVSDSFGFWNVILCQWSCGYQSFVIPSWKHLQVKQCSWSYSLSKCQQIHAKWHGITSQKTWNCVTSKHLFSYTKTQNTGLRMQYSSENTIQIMPDDVLKNNTSQSTVLFSPSITTLFLPVLYAHVCVTQGLGIRCILEKPNAKSHMKP